ncbi:MAG: hypothetical protein EAZ15_03400 [Sphingobacteriales bacterium]|nr:MAG: hypothetical protein EAZ15_03400 [Sphingobacteriales bacterium]
MQILSNLIKIKYPIIFAPFMHVSGMALFPFIVLSKKKFIHNPQIIRHEIIHLKQQLELLILPFYALYLLNYLVNLLKYKNHNKAYLNIVFEQGNRF